MKNIFPVCPPPAGFWKIKSNFCTIKKIALSSNAVLLPTIVQAVHTFTGKFYKKNLKFWNAFTTCNTFSSTEHLFLFPTWLSFCCFKLFF